MVKKNLTLSAAGWAKLKSIKDLMIKTNSSIISWEATFNELITFYETNRNKNMSPPPKDHKQNDPNSIKAPELPNHQTASRLPAMKISLPTPKISGITTKISQESNNNPSGGQEFGDQNIDLNIPLPPKRKPVIIDADEKALKDIALKDTSEMKYILIECQICGTRPIAMPVPRKFVLEAKEPVVEITYIHGNPKHAIVAQLDHDFQVRRNRASKAVFEN